MSKVSQEKIVLTDSLSPKGRGCVSSQKLDVIGALPHEEVLIQPAGRKKGRNQAYLREVITPSADRVEPRCSHVPDCGGCVFQQMDYFAQLDEKEAIVQKHFAPLIEKEKPEIRPILGCEDPWRYRNKMEFSFSENREGEKFLGLMLAGSRGRVLNLKECYLVSEWFTETLGKIRGWWENTSFSAYNHNNDTGHLRCVTLREAKQGTGKMVMLTVSGNPQFALKKTQVQAFVDLLKGEGVSLFLQVHQIAKGRPTQFFEMLLDGPDHITETLHIELDEEEVHTLNFKISPTSFFQPNTLQAQKLYSEGLQMLSQLEGALVFDLYCGGATLGLTAAKKAKKVVGVEINPHAVFDAGWNQEVNEIQNFSIHRGDVGSCLEKMDEKPDVVIVDPPRAGLDERALRELLRFDPKEILYISCNPKTQAANCTELVEKGYRLKAIQPVDQFPHTIHIENIVLLEKG